MKTAQNLIDSDIISKNTPGQEKLFRYKDETSSALFSSYTLNENVIINRGEASSPGDTIIKEKQENAYFVFFFQIAGKSQNLSFEKPLLQGPHSSSFYYFHREGAVNFLNSKNSRFLTLMVRPDFLQDKILSCCPAPKPLNKTIGGLTTHTALLANSSYTYFIQKVLDSIIRCPYQGGIKQVFLEGKLLELLALYFDSLTGAEEECTRQGTGIKRSDLKKIEEVKEHLGSVFQTPPTLAELSRFAGLNEFKLKRGFKALFGMTVFDYIRLLRMEKGRELLLDGEKNISQVSYIVGYSNPSNFTRNFKKQFGVYPKNIK